MRRVRGRMALVLGALAVLAIGWVAGHLTGQAVPVNKADVQENEVHARDARVDAAPTSDTGIGPTLEGAVRAAARYLVQIDSPSFLDGRAREALLDEIASSDARGRLAERLAEVADFVTARLGIDPEDVADPAFVWRAVPAGWQVHSFDGNQAVVAIWGTGVLVAEGRQLDQPGWRTSELALQWERDGWRLTDITTLEGPTPPLAGTAGVRAVGHLINEFQPFEAMPVSAEGESS